MNYKGSPSPVIFLFFFMKQTIYFTEIDFFYSNSHYISMFIYKLNLISNKYNLKIFPVSDKI